MSFHEKGTRPSKRPKLPKKRVSWILVLAFLLSVYTAVSFYLMSRSGKRQAGWSHDWKLDPMAIRKPIPRQSPPFRDSSENKLSADTIEWQTTKFGFVMRDFARRVLSRHISNSNVLVVAPDAVLAAKEGIHAKEKNQGDANIYDDVDFKSPYSLGGTFLLHAAAEGHDIHAIDFMVDSLSHSVMWQEDLDAWWHSFDLANDVTADSVRHWSSTKFQPKWIIAAVFDHLTPHRLEDADIVWRGAEIFLKASTITYIVVTMHSRKRDSGQYEFGGLAAARALLDHRYKLQTLYLSRYHPEPDNEAWTEQRYGPNAIFKTCDDIEELLIWGADQTSHHGNNKEVFSAYIFATQGLDLAIPSSRVFLDDASRVTGSESTLQINLYKSLQFKPCPQSQMPPRLNITFSEIIGETSVKVTIPLEGGNYQIRHYHPHANEDTGFTYQFSKPDQHILGPLPDEIEMWYSNKELNEAEATCARLGNFSKCSTRVIDHSGNVPTPTSTQEGEQLNIFLIMLDPISLPHFHRSMPKTTKSLRELGFLEFGNYTSVGPNSGMNQAALYSGILLADRNGIKKNATKGQWLWDRLRDNGFITLKAENGCIENSNMLKSLRPSTTHGRDLSQLFCFDFDRPNCLGPDLAAQHLITYGDEFLTLYEKSRKEKNPRLRWAAFLHFIDTHEDTMVLASMLDKTISDFLLRLGKGGIFERALAIVTSDHGLHYGPYFQSRSGRREAVEPVLFVRVPSVWQSRKNMSALRENRRKWITPFDVHETMLSVSLPNDARIRDGRRGTSLLNMLESDRETCEVASDIPAKYCSLKGGSTGASSATCTKMPRPPNVLSFYGDLPPGQRTRFPVDCKQMWNKTASIANVEQRCLCATSHRGWNRCDKHPWGKDGIFSQSHPEEYFALIKCRGHMMSVDTRVLSSHPSLNQSMTVMKTQTVAPPTILIIEVDSVSLPYAERHLPMTRSFLRSHRMTRSSTGQIQCSGGICAPEFTLFSLNGPNSIANQVAALSGCLVVRFHDSCFRYHGAKVKGCLRQGKFVNSLRECIPCPKGSFLSDPLSECQSDDARNCCTITFPLYNASRICQDPSRDEYGLQLFRRGPRRHVTYCSPREDKSTEKLESPWIFDVAKERGYVTYAGAEFCYEGSPFVVQNNVFSVSPDFELQRLYCRLQQCRQYNFSAIGPRLCASQKRRSGPDSSNPGFDLIRELWSTAALVNVPKFVYLNAMAAHDYDPNWIKMVSVAEEYDWQLQNFLQFIVLHPSFSNTVIVVRADHGLQGGPATLEYSMQVEHREPWTQMLLPQSLASGSGLTQLYKNQDKVLTSHDLYRTLWDLMDTSSALVPPWSYNILRDSIPATRTCKDAKVPLYLCPCEEQVHDRPPSF